MWEVYHLYGPYSVEDTGISWNSPITWASNQIVGASDLNTQIRDNLNYLFSSRPLGAALFVNTANYTTSSTTAVDIDATHVTLTLNLSGTRVFAVGMALLQCSTTSSQAAFIQCYSSGLNAVGGNQGMTPSGSRGWVSCAALFTGLTPGSNTFKLRFGVTNPAATATVNCLEGVNAWYPVALHVWEV